jgi:hypothetical protein
VGAGGGSCNSGVDSANRTTPAVFVGEGVKVAVAVAAGMAVFVGIGVMLMLRRWVNDIGRVTACSLNERVAEAALLSGYVKGIRSVSGSPLEKHCVKRPRPGDLMPYA